MLKLLFIIVFFLPFLKSQFLLKAAQKLYRKGQPIKVKSRSVKSMSGLPYDFYHLSFCEPIEGPKEEVENLGEILFGDRIKNTVYDLRMKKDIPCAFIDSFPNTKCPNLDAKTIKKFRSFITDRYFVQLEVDSLPAASVFTGTKCQYKPFKLPEIVHYENVDGFDIGCVDGKKIFLNNHFSFNIKYHDERDGASIIAVEVTPTSIVHNGNDTCHPVNGISPNTVRLALPHQKTIENKEKFKKMKQGSFRINPQWSYSVTFQAVPQRWSSRWDNYVQSKQANIHWYSIINSCLIVLFLAGMIAMIMVRILYKDIARYNLDDNDDEPDERGWKMVHGEVFRPPKLKAMFTVFIGSGIQILGMLICTLPFAAIGIFSVSNRGYFFTAIIVTYFLMGLPAGFFSLRFYKMFDGVNWKVTTFLVAFLFPSVVFATFAFLNIFVKIGANSTIAFPFLQLVVLFLFFIGIYVPLVFMGGACGYKRNKVEFPCEVSKFPRLIPQQPWYLRSVITVLLGGVMPFGAVFVEFYFVMTSVWMHKLYFFFGFIFLIFVILVIVTGEISIVLVYLQLCNEDYRWWWRSFITGGFAAVYILVFSVYYFLQLHPGSFWLAIVYFEYMTLICAMFFVMLGTVGFCCSLLFIRRIYSSIRID